MAAEDEIRVKDVTPTIDAFRTGDKFLIDGPSGTANMSKETLLSLTAQNALAGNVAPAFDPAKPNDAGGYAYYEGEIVAYNGATYRFKVNHSSGAWIAAEADRYNAGESLELFVKKDNPLYLFTITDANGTFLFGVKKDGSIEWQTGVPLPIRKILDEKLDSEEGKSLINAVFADGVSVVTNNPKYLYMITDKDGVFLFGVKKDGSVDWQKGLPNSIAKELASKVNTEFGKSLIDSVFADGVSVVNDPKFVHILTDSLSRLLGAIGKDGKFNFYTPVKFIRGVEWSEHDIDDLSELLKARGSFGGCGDWSDKEKLHIPKPRCAVVDFTNILSMPVTKTQDLHGVMQFWDMDGNYFKKNVVMNAQGNSSMAFPKKNISLDLCNDEWVGDNTFKLKIGDWVEQDSFHLKAYYTDYFRCRGAVGYDLFNDIQKTRGVQHDVPWKEALIDQSKVGYGQGLFFSDINKTNLQLDTGARNHPLCFPCIVYLNGSFYGIFSWQLKKHRDNYHQKKDVLTHIHLDGELGADEFFSGNIDWTDFEVRNPKGLKDVDGNKYDGDNPTELSDTDPSSSFVKGKIVDLANESFVLDSIVSEYGITSDQFKDEFERVFDVDNLIDYIIFIDIIGDADAFRKNWQWTTYDGVKWYVNVYDLDGSWGSEASGTYLVNPYTTHVRSTHKLPTSYILESPEYTVRLKSRYAELRQSVISHKSIMDKFNEWLGNVGVELFELEYSENHWKNSPCNRDAEVDTHWQLVRDENGSPVMGQSNTYSSTTAYSVDDEVFYGYAPMGFYKFVCLENTIGNKPILQQYFKDNIYCLSQWVKKEIENMDVLYEFNNNLQGE